MMGNSESSDGEQAAAASNLGEADAVQKFQLALLDYLLVNGQKDPSLLVSVPTQCCSECGRNSFFEAKFYT